MEDGVPDHRLSILLLGFLVGAVGAFFLAVQGDLANAATDNIAPAVAPPTDTPANDAVRPGTMLILGPAAPTVLSGRRA